MQKVNELKPDLEARLVLTFMLSSLSGLHSEEKGYFDENPHRKKVYVELVIDSLCAALAPEKMSQQFANAAAQRAQV